MVNIPTYPFALALLTDQRTTSESILSSTAEQEWRELHWSTAFKQHINLGSRVHGR